MQELREPFPNTVKNHPLYEARKVIGQLKTHISGFRDFVSLISDIETVSLRYLQTSNISRTLVGNKSVDYSDVVNACSTRPSADTVLPAKLPLYVWHEFFVGYLEAALLIIWIPNGPWDIAEYCSSLGVNGMLHWPNGQLIVSVVTFTRVLQTYGDELLAVASLRNTCYIAFWMHIHHTYVARYIHPMNSAWQKNEEGKGYSSCNRYWEIVNMELASIDCDSHMM